MSTVIVSVTAFTLLTLTLVGLLLIARRMLVPSGPVSILVNGGGEHDLRVEAGQTLLAALAQAGVFLPAACGGKGTCGACRVRVTSDAGDLQPSESAHIGRAAAQEGWRLACQLKIRQDLDVELPPEVFGVRKRRCTVRSAHNVATFIRELVLEPVDDDTLEFRAGSYVQVECPEYHTRFADFEIEPEYRDAWTRYAFFELESESAEPVTRAYSLANSPSEAGMLMLNVRIATPPAGSSDIPPGVGSSYLFSLHQGDEVTVTGPFGDFFAEDSDAEMVFVGGGAGMAPMRSHILDQLERIGTDRKITFWYGARSVREAFYVELFDRLEADHDNFEWHLVLSDPAPEDGWTGDVGFVHHVLYTKYLEGHPTPEDIEYYLCGPPVMIAACRKMLDELGVDPRNVRFDDFGS